MVSHEHTSPGFHPNDAESEHQKERVPAEKDAPTETHPTPSRTFSEHSKGTEDSPNMGTSNSSDGDTNSENGSEEDTVDSRSSEEKTSEGKSFPKKIGPNEWLHADGIVYKKVIFVIRKDQSEALDVMLASNDYRFGKNRSEVVRTLIDRAGIKGGDTDPNPSGS